MKSKGMGIYPTFTPKEVELFSTLQIGDEWKTNPELEHLLDITVKELNSFGLNKQYCEEYVKNCRDFCSDPVSDYISYDEYLDALDCFYYIEIIFTEDDWRNEPSNLLSNFKDLPKHITSWYKREQELTNKEIVVMCKLIYDNAHVVELYDELSDKYKQYKELVEESRDCVDLTKFCNFTHSFKELIYKYVTLHRENLQPIDSNEIFSETLFRDRHKCTVEDRVNLVDESQIIDYFNDTAFTREAMYSSPPNDNFMWALAYIKERVFLVSMIPQRYHNKYDLKPCYRELTQKERVTKKTAVFSLELDTSDYCKFIKAMQDNNLQYKECTDPYF